jgi:hypothetical protein
MFLSVSNDLFFSFPRSAWERIVRRLILLLIVILIINGKSVSQHFQPPRIEAAQHQIDSLLSTYPGGPYESESLVDIDSSVGNLGIADGQIKDPYGTLKRCFLFVAVKQDTSNDEWQSSVGIFRNDSILWLSDYVEGSHRGSEFCGTLDLNKSGTVDILTGYTYGSQMQYEMLIINSWNGTRGIRIDDHDSSGISSINALDGSFKIVDENGDGMYKIYGSIGDVAVGGGGFDIKRRAVYTWNGKYYGEWKK